MVTQLGLTPIRIKIEFIHTMLVQKLTLWGVAGAGFKNV
jgi:hypothetical protein